MSQKKIKINQKRATSREKIRATKAQQKHVFVMKYKEYKEKEEARIWEDLGIDDSYIMRNNHARKVAGELSEGGAL